MSPASPRRRRTIGARIRSRARKRRSSSATTGGFSPTSSPVAPPKCLPGNGFQVVLTPEPTPTPSVSFAVKAPARHRRRDDHRQPQSANVQWLQTQVALRRIERLRDLPGSGKLSRSQSRPDLKLADAIKVETDRGHETFGLRITRRSKSSWTSSSSRSPNCALPTRLCSAWARVASNNCWPAQPAK